MDSYNAIHMYSELTGKRLVAYRSETAGHLAVLKTDVAWNVHHMEKLIVPIPTTVIRDLTATFLLNQTEKNLLESCGINKVRAVSSVKLFSCSIVDALGLSMIFTLRKSQSMKQQEYSRLLP